MIKGKIGVGVEGPSDLQFWDKVLPKHLQGWQFDIRNMKNRDKLVRAVPDLYEEFRNLKRQAAFVLLGSDKSPCVCEILGFFDARILAEAKKPLTTRYLHLCVGSSLFSVESELGQPKLAGDEIEHGDEVD